MYMKHPSFDESELLPYGRLKVNLAKKVYNDLFVLNAVNLLNKHL